MSYPDFIFKDKGDRIHIFEVKSVNASKSQSVEEKAYKQKIQKLKQAYLSASKITSYIFISACKSGARLADMVCEKWANFAREYE
ncbi:hypothetical protein [Helicobacter canis]|uniref:Uncharacterized protein n=1 Tax=Helicobacter canis TaxID=29419 RepID=A0A5M9QRE8_9HELI|nr:hypothetical protein [Helicobacter canis]KAA8709575.1 hypothetical protein F4V45_04670 [Helicobacter canis]